MWYQLSGVLISRGIRGISFTSMDSSWWDSAGENLHVTSPRDLGFVQHDGWVPGGGILRASVLRKPDRNYKTSYDWASGIIQCHFHHILVIKSEWQDQPIFRVRTVHKGIKPATLVDRDMMQIVLRKMCLLWLVLGQIVSWLSCLYAGAQVKRMSGELTLI